MLGAIHHDENRQKKLSPKEIDQWPVLRSCEIHKVLQDSPTLEQYIARKEAFGESIDIAI